MKVLGPCISLREKHIRSMENSERRRTFSMANCTYCRCKFQQTLQGRSSAICEKCEQKVKAHGKPSPCEYCKIVAAFLGKKCQRCANSRLRYGEPYECEQCKQKCAFDRKGEDKTLDGKLLCWLCTLSYKRALERAEQSNGNGQAHMKLSQQRVVEHKDQKLTGNNKRLHGIEESKLPYQLKSEESNGPTPAKVGRVGVPPSRLHISAEHGHAEAILKERVAALQKQLRSRDSQLLAKDRTMTALKADNFTTEIELRKKMKCQEKEFCSKITTLQSKIANLLKEVASLSKRDKRAERLSTTKISKATRSSSSDTNSPAP